MMNLRVLFLSIGLTLLISCNKSSGIEQSVKIHDPDTNTRFIRILDDKNVNYRIASDGQIFYPIEQSDKVKAAHKAIFGSIDSSKKGASVQTQDANEISSRLTDLGINFEVFHGDDKVTFTWSSSVNAEAMHVVSEVISKREGSRKWQDTF